uniref:Uncharacterized protein n=1 Tax=Arundo donax TaxID=35708 RepID=A0A0A9AMD4_ARUDO
MALMENCFWHFQCPDSFTSCVDLIPKGMSSKCILYIVVSTSLSPRDRYFKDLVPYHFLLGIGYIHVKKKDKSAAFLVEIWTRAFHMSISLQWLFI